MKVKIEKITSKKMTITNDKFQEGSRVEFDSLQLRELESMVDLRLLGNDLTMEVRELLEPLSIDLDTMALWVEEI